MKIFTQFLKETIWRETSLRDTLDIIKVEFPDTDVDGTFKYIKDECSKGKTVTLGECRFRME